MSAREEALQEMTHGHLYLDADRAAELLDAFRAEVLREAAQEIRRWAEAGEGYLFDEERCGALAAANHVDPDVNDQRAGAL